MTIDLADNGIGLRDAVVAELGRIFPLMETELPSAVYPGYSAAFLRSSTQSDLKVELIVGSDWTYTLFAGATITVESYPMNESKTDRIGRIVREITAVARTTIPPWPEDGGAA